MTMLILFANLLYLAANFTSSPLRLRVFSICGTSLLAVYHAVQPQPVLSLVGWNLFFVGLNLIHIVRLLSARRR